MIGAAKGSLRLRVFLIRQIDRAQLEIHIGQPGFGLQHIFEHLPRFAKLLLPHQRGRLNEAGRDIVFVETEDGQGRFHRVVEFTARHLQLRQSQTGLNIIRPQLESLTEFALRRVPLTALGVHASQVEVIGRILRRPNGQCLQLCQRRVQIALVGRQTRCQFIRIIVVRILPQDLGVECNGLLPFALAHQNIDLPLQVGQPSRRVWPPWPPDTASWP